MINYLDKFNLAKKKAYVVGGTGLIGREVSFALSSAGCDLVILDVNTIEGNSLVAEIERCKLSAKFEKLDVSDMDKLDEHVELILGKHGVPEIFVNCSYPRTDDWERNSFDEITLKSFRQNVDLHMNSFSWLAKLFADAMMNNDDGGSIIQFGSIYGVVGQDLSVYHGTDMKENMTYAAIKGGITNLTRLMASYYGKFNIRVNTICPGGITGHVAGQSDQQNPIFVKQYCQKTPLNRMGTPEDIAPPVLFLASKAASYITGITLMVDGGWTAI